MSCHRTENHSAKTCRHRGPGGPEVKQLLLLMEKDKNGRISKQEYVNVMEAQFDRLDVNKYGELAVREIRPIAVASV